MGSVEHASGLPDQPFSNYEQVYLNMSRAFSHLKKEHWGIHVICEIKHDAPPGTDTVKALSSAWTRLAAEFPGLRMVPVGREKHFPAMDETAWLDRTFFTSSNLASQDVIAQAKPRNHPSLYYLPTTSEVILLTQHWRSDGLGACMLLDRLFQILATNPTGPVQPNPPSPSLESAAGASSSSDPSLQSYARTYIDNFHARAVHAGGLPFQGDTATPPSLASRMDLDLSAGATSSLVSACKSQGISVTAAIHSALAQTVFSYLPSEEEKRAGYTTVMAVNMRPFLPAPYNSASHACQTFVASITPTVAYRRDDGPGPGSGSASSFLDSAKSLTHEYRTWHSGDKDMFMRSLHWIYQYHVEKLSAPPPPGAVRKPPSGVTLSSLGVVDNYLKGRYEGDGGAGGKGVEVGKFRFGVSMMTRQTILYAWTFRGKLTLSLSYNAAYYEESMVKEVLNRVKRGMEVGLGLELE